METTLYNLDRQDIGAINLDKEIFFSFIRPDLIKRVVEWQLAKRRAGTHQTKTISGVSGTTKKPFKQKGTGNARQGSLRSAQMRGGGVSHGPVMRSHAFDLPKKVRKLGLRHALSLKILEQSFIVVDNFSVPAIKTTFVRRRLDDFGFKSYCCIDSVLDEGNVNFIQSVMNLYNVKFLPQIGANVYDIMKSDCVMITRSALEKLSERLK